MDDENKIKPDEFGCNLFIETNEEHPNVITNLLGIEASECVVKGSPRVNKKTNEIIPGNYNQRNLWVYKINIPEAGAGLYLNSALEMMVDFLDTNKDIFLKIFNKYEKRHLLCYAYYYDFNPYFAFNKELIKRLCEYSIDIEFDTYYLAE